VCYNGPDFIDFAEEERWKETERLLFKYKKRKKIWTDLEQTSSARN
jgi:hypothetical protein